MPSRRRTRYLRLVVGTTIAPVTQWTKLFSQTDTFRKSGLQRWPLGLREPAAFAHCISPLSLDETRDMQGGITHSNRRRTPSGRFESIENTSTSCRLTTISLKLLDHGVNRANSGSTDESHERLCVKNASLDGRAPPGDGERNLRFSRIRDAESTQNCPTRFQYKLDSTTAILSIS